MEDENNVYRLSNKQIIASSFTVIGALSMVVLVGGGFIFNSILDSIQSNSEEIRSHDSLIAGNILDINSLKHRSAECETRQNSYAVGMKKYQERDEERMDIINQQIATLQSERAANSNLINECFRVIYK